MAGVSQEDRPSSPQLAAHVNIRRTLSARPPGITLPLSRALRVPKTCVTWADALQRAVPQNRMRWRGRWGSPGGGVGPREVDARYLRGTWQVDQGHRLGRQIAVVLAWPVAPVRHLLAVCGYRVSADSAGAVSVRVTAAADEWFVRLGTRSLWLDALGGTGSARWFAQVRRFCGQCPWLSVRWAALMPVGTDI
jgi:hypothetical protein